MLCIHSGRQERDLQYFFRALEKLPVDTRPVSNFSPYGTKRLENRFKVEDFIYRPSKYDRGLGRVIVQPFWYVNISIDSISLSLVGTFELDSPEVTEIREKLGQALQSKVTRAAIRKNALRVIYLRADVQRKVKRYHHYKGLYTKAYKKAFSWWDSLFSGQRMSVDQVFDQI